MLATVQEPTYLYEMVLAPDAEVLDRVSGAAGAPVQFVGLSVRPSAARQRRALNQVVADVRTVCVEHVALCGLVLRLSA